jgi:hypothetical protein
VRVWGVEEGLLDLNENRKRSDISNQEDAVSDFVVVREETALARPTDYLNIKIYYHMTGTNDCYKGEPK